MVVRESLGHCAHAIYTGLLYFFPGPLAACGARRRPAHVVHSADLSRAIRLLPLKNRKSRHDPHLREVRLCNSNRLSHPAEPEVFFRDLLQCSRIGIFPQRAQKLLVVAVAMMP